MLGGGARAPNKEMLLGLYRLRQKKLHRFIFTKLCQNFINYDNFWHTYT